MSRFLLALASLSLLFASRPAHAQCGAAAPAIVWSYPAAGQGDVPTNARVWLLTSFGRQPREVTIDGVTVRQSGVDFSYVPDQPFTPNAPHQVTVTYPGVAPLTIDFTTGAGPVDLPAPDFPLTRWATPLPTRTLSAQCQAALSAMSCFNAGEDTHLVFATEGTPLAWLIERVPLNDTDPRELHLWPAGCGLPEVFARAADTRVCGRDYRLHALGPTGLRTMGDRFCAANLVKTAAPGAPDVPPSPSDAGAGADAEFTPLIVAEDSPSAAEARSKGPARSLSSGCSLGGGSPAAAVLLLLALAMTWLATRAARR
jgi:hypothetical protein